MADFVVAIDGEDLSGGLQRRHHGAGLLHFARHHARHHHGVLPVHGGADGRLWKFFDPAADRRAGHGVPVPQCPLLLGVPALLHRDFLRTVRDERRADGRLDGLRSAERNSRCGARPVNRDDALDYGHRLVYGVGSDGRFELRHDHSHHADQRHVHDAAASDPVVAAHHRDPCPSGIPGSAGSRNPVALRSNGRNELLPAGRHHHESGSAHGPCRRPSAAVAAPVLVLRPS